MVNWGTVPVGSVLPFPFGSYDGETGASLTASGLAVTDIEVYKASSMTQRASDAGYTLLDTDGLDIDTMTGVNGFTIDTGDDTDAGFFAADEFYYVVVAGITVDGQTVNFVAGTFGLMAAAPTVSDVATAVWSAVTRTLTSGSNIALAKGTGVTGFNDLDAAGIRTALGLASANVDTQLSGIATSATAAAATAAKLDDTLEDIAGTNRFTSNALSQAPTGSGGGATAEEIADAVWDENLGDHLTSGSTGAGLNAAGSAGDPWATSLPGAYGAGTAGKLIGDSLDAAVSTRASQTSLDTVGGIADAIKLKTDNLPSDPADASVVAGLIAAVEAKVDIVDANVDAVLADTGTDGVVVAAGSKTGYSLGVGGIAATAFAAGAIDAAAIAANAIGASELAADAVDEILDEQIGDGTITMRQALRLITAALGGLVSGAGTTTITFRNANNSADAIVATVDADGNRSAVTLNL
jgi:hypothetical protein